MVPGAIASRWPLAPEQQRRAQGVRGRRRRRACDGPWHRDHQRPGGMVGPSWRCGRACGGVDARGAGNDGRDDGVVGAGQRARPVVGAAFMPPATRIPHRCRAACRPPTGLRTGVRIATRQGTVNQVPPRCHVRRGRRCVVDPSSTRRSPRTRASHPRFAPALRTRAPHPRPAPAPRTRTPHAHPARAPRTRAPRPHVARAPLTPAARDTPLAGEVVPACMDGNASRAGAPGATGRAGRAPRGLAHIPATGAGRAVVRPGGRPPCQTG